MSRVTFKIFENHCYGHFPIIFYSFQNTESRRWYLKFTHQITWNHRVVLRDYYMTFSISALVLARDSHIKPDSEAGGLMWVEGWYQGPYGKFHVIIFLSHILHWPFPSIDFYTIKMNVYFWPPGFKKGDNWNANRTHPFIFSSRGHDRQSWEQNNRMLISLLNNGEDDKHAHGCTDF